MADRSTPSMGREKLIDFPLMTTRSTTRWLRKAILWS